MVLYMGNIKGSSTADSQLRRRNWYGLARVAIIPFRSFFSYSCLYISLRMDSFVEELVGSPAWSHCESNW